MTCFKCGTGGSTVRLVRLGHSASGGGAGRYACTSCVPHGQGEMDGDAT